MEGFAAAASLLPPELRKAAASMTDGEKRRCEELRLRPGRPASALILGRETPFSHEPVTPGELLAVLETATRSSLHTAVEALSRGYISARGGVRVGVCGTAVEEAPGGGLRSFSSLSLRIPRAVPGCADGVWERVTEGGFRSLLIVSPPGGGKTTLLRELVRRLSNAGARVCAADERGEIAACGADGLPGFDVGAHTDVMTGVPKARAVEMLLRAMNPEVVAMDEVAGREDALALLDAAGCGVRLLATMHGACPEELEQRQTFRLLKQRHVFSRCVTVSCGGGIRRYDVRELT